MDPLQLIVTAGAAGAFFWVLRQLADGKFHTHSEVEGLREDKKALLDVNAGLSAALKETNKELAALAKAFTQFLEQEQDA